MLALSYVCTKDRSVAKVIAELVADEQRDIELRSIAYINLLMVVGEESPNRQESTEWPITNFNWPMVDFYRQS